MVSCVTGGFFDLEIEHMVLYGSNPFKWYNDTSPYMWSQRGNSGGTNQVLWTIDYIGGAWKNEYGAENPEPY